MTTETEAPPNMDNSVGNHTASLARHEEAIDHLNAQLSELASTVKRQSETIGKIENILSGIVATHGKVDVKQIFGLLGTIVPILIIANYLIIAPIQSDLNEHRSKPAHEAVVVAFSRIHQRLLVVERQAQTCNPVSGRSTPAPLNSGQELDPLLPHVGGSSQADLLVGD